MTQLTDSIWGYVLPDNLQEAELHFQPSVQDMLNDILGMSELIIWYTGNTCGSPKQKITVKLPVTGSYRFLFTTKTATEEDAKKVVASEEFFINGNSQGIYYCDYLIPHDVCEWYKHARLSLHSLLRSKNLDPNNNYAIIEKLNTDGEK